MPLAANANAAQRFVLWPLLLGVYSEPTLKNEHAAGNTHSTFDDLAGSLPSDMWTSPESNAARRTRLRVYFVFEARDNRINTHFG